MSPKLLCLAVTVLMAAALAPQAHGAEIVRLTPSTYPLYVPEGKEVDAIYGDFALRNDHVVAVVADPLPTRNANMTTRTVGGCLIDLTRLDAQSDQLTAYYAAGISALWEFGGVEVDGERLDDSVDMTQLRADGNSVSLMMHLPGGAGERRQTVRYTLEDGQDRLQMRLTYENEGDEPLTVSNSTQLRMDQSRDGEAIKRSPDGKFQHFWIYDDWFNQAYVFTAPDGTFEASRADSGRVPTQLRYLREGESSLTVEPKSSIEFVQWITPAPTLLEALSRANAGLGAEQAPLLVQVRDQAGLAVEGAFVELRKSGIRYAWGRSPRNGQLAFSAPPGVYDVIVSDLGRDTLSIKRDTSDGERVEAVLSDPGYVTARIADAQGAPIPCKVQFFGKDGVEDPFFGPDSGSTGIQNVRYTADGTFQQNLPAGKYEVIVSYGNEYNAIFTEIDVVKGKETLLTGDLVRAVNSSGWVSSDFHSHSTPSGDNTSSQFGRVLNLLAEHVEFAPCTEHNRIDTYRPHLQRLNAEALMATCTGMELTGRPGGLNHQNAFPLHLHPHTQDGGAPVTDLDPEIQIERLAMWDDGAEKLVQQNHPDMHVMFFDRDGDGTRDDGLDKMFGFMDVIEIHPPAAIFRHPFSEAPQGSAPRPNRILSWMQLWNLGRGVPGVVNTDAHANFHGSGWLRNYIKSSTDVPSEIDTLEMVRASEKGNLFMTNGPFLDVKAWAEVADEGEAAVAGDTVTAENGSVQLRIRIQCANWLDVDRVQVLLNGRYSPEHNYTRKDHPDLFRTGVTKFDQTISLSLEADTHVVVATIGEELRLGPVVGPHHADDQPVAMMNPIFVDVDGGGFQPNGDELDVDPATGGGVSSP